MKKILFAVLLSACGHDRAIAPTVSQTNPPPRVSTSAPVVPDAAVTPVETAKPVETPVAVTAMPSTFDDSMKQGKELAAKGEHDRAKELFEAAAKLAPKKPEPYVELSRLYISTNDRARAVIAANKAVKLAPQSSQAWNTKGRAELSRFDYDKAIEAFSKSVELDRDNVWAWNNLGYTELQLKKYDEAVEHLTEATTRKGAEGYMFNNLGTALEQLDRLDEARTAYDAGGKLGSTVAAASRKRLEGVKSIAIAKELQQSEPTNDSEKTAKTYDVNEGSQDGSAAGSDAGDHSTM
jgi:tetratricopeptide (TPR) repeat protein